MSNSTGSDHTSAIDERSPHYSKISECDSREGEGERKGRGREREKKGEESVPIAGII